jgi:hypothetical protein
VLIVEVLDEGAVLDLLLRKPRGGGTPYIHMPRLYRYYKCHWIGFLRFFVQFIH